jgi:hypothetical protein
MERDCCLSIDGDLIGRPAKENAEEFAGVLC